MKKRWWVLLATVWIGGLGAAQEAQLELLDGSTLRGEIVSVQNGRYRVQTRHLGVIELPESEIRSLSLGGGAIGRGLGPASSQIQALQQGLISDEKSMAMIMELVADPQLQAMLDDPELMRAVSEGNLEALSSHPDIVRLMNDPRIRAIAKQSGAIPTD